MQAAAEGANMSSINDWFLRSLIKISLVEYWFLRESITIVFISAAEAADPAMASHSPLVAHKKSCAPFAFSGISNVLRMVFAKEVGVTGFLS